MNVVPTVGVLIVENNQVLLVKHGEGASHVNGVYGWPGGRIDAGETLKQAAIRELFEETGLQTTEEHIYPILHKLEPVIIERKNGERQLFSAELFLCSQYTGTLRGTDETTPEWVAMEKLDTLSLLPNVKFIVDTSIHAHE
jgi:8-oxo-dGTP diphosphatase